MSVLPRAPYALPFRRLLAEQLAHDESAVREVEALIAQLRERKNNEDQWQAIPPNHCDYGRVPHG